ncbi:MAG: RDD family protein [Trichodesmium sp. MAG_R03]|nr:RDD family protein [Trichodesmium sp. MAG_R03]
MSQRNYASFNQRFIAILIDGVILLLVIYLTLGKPIIIDGNTHSELRLIKFSLYQILNAILGWLYFSILESSQLQGTLGKQVVGISVTNLQGYKISFGKATVRYFGKSFFLVVWIAAILIGITV